MGKYYKGSEKEISFPEVEDRLKIRINKTPKFSTITIGHGNMNSQIIQV